AAATGSGQLLGVFPRVRPAKDMVFLDAGDVLVLYTDGVTESVVDGSRWEESGLVEAIAAAGPSPSATAEVVRAHLSSLAGTGGADDATVVVVGPAGVDPD
ncbi:MAG TPA: SpoIIE family protein phosphatase, partial [Acidimicrobiales bacterium]|nr:SpoIIE family protein phosphatase [Acidimicrobiales bacterium]